MRGTVAEVLVREKVEKPELVDDKVLGDVVARAPGLVTDLSVLEGEAAVKEGDTVLAGELLIAGNIHIEGPEYGEVDLGWRRVKANGLIYARTWRTLEAEIPLEARVKSYTGEEIALWSLNLLGRRINFYGNSGISFAEYDKITDVWTASLPGGQEMPLSLTRETVRAYDTAPAPVDIAAAEELLRARLDEALRQQLGSGEVISADYTSRAADGKLTVRLQAECKEEIGKFVPFADQAQDTQP